MRQLRRSPALADWSQPLPPLIFSASFEHKHLVDFTETLMPAESLVALVVVVLGFAALAAYAGHQRKTHHKPRQPKP